MKKLKKRYDHIPVSPSQKDELDGMFPKCMTYHEIVEALMDSYKKHNKVL
jgi:aerobic-type carbon monoxide dehydrogenase small subunit (CoxS/CutS family)